MEITSEPEIENVNIWQQLELDFIQSRNEAEIFKITQNTECQVPYNPKLQYIEDEIFCILVEILEKTITKAIETNSLKYQKSPFNAIDCIAEMLWNFNPRHPERRIADTHLFDMEWVKNQLKTKPRPYFPFSWIWSKNYAAIKIQAFMKGYWVRRRTEVQEMRQFWKVVKKEMLGVEVPRLPSLLLPYLPFYEKTQEPADKPPGDDIT